MIKQNKKMYSNNGYSYEKTIETLRNSSEFTHLTNEVYLDYAANGVYMASLIKDYALKLAPQTPQTSCSLFSNPHSHSQSGSYTNMFIELTREKILNMFNTTQNEYDLVYVHNVTDGLKLLAENFNFNFQEEEEEEVKESNIDENSSSCFVYLNDNHTSVLGMRETVTAASVYCAFESDSSKDSLDLTLVKSKKCYSQHRQRHLFVYPTQSNFNGRKYAFDLLEKVKSNALMMKRKEWFICLDTASYVCTSSLDLTEHQPDFLVVSFYKIFGFPTGMAALLIKKSDRVKNSILRKKCESRYFGGGTLQFALVDQDYVSVKQAEYKYHEYLENGTVSYLGVIGVALAIEKFEKLGLSTRFNSVMTKVQDYLKILYSDLVLKLENLKHYNHEKLVELYRKCNDTHIEYGPIVAFNLKNSFGSYIGYALVDKLAQENRIHMRTGCFCNLGACKMFLNKNDDLIKSFKVHGHKCGDHIDIIDGKPTGAIRVSLGYSTIQTDIDMFLKFLRDYFIETKCTEIAAASMDRKEENNTSLVSQNSQQQYFKITSLYIYPIKSCAPMKIETSWPMTDQGLAYDRFWVIVDLNGIVLTQKRIPLLTHLRPFIDLKRNTLALYFKNKKFELKLKNPSDELKRKQNIILNNMTNQVGCDEGDEIAEWLTRVFELKEPCRLVKSIVNNVFVNKAEFLLINEKSVASLRKYLVKSLNEPEQHDERLNKTIDEFLMLQFRANFIVNTELNSDQVSTTEFEEELWSRLKMLNKNIKFKVVENCTRCQMININQSNAILNEANAWSGGESQKYCSMLLKQLYKFKLNSKFGIYLSKDSDNEEKIASTNEDISLEALVNKNLYENKTNQISIGDIGIAFKETK